VGGRPLSWSKLSDVATWLETSSAHSDPYWVVEGHLQLAEGRAHFARIEASDRATRRVAAAGGFERVLADPAATSSQRQRAELGLQRLNRGSEGLGATAVQIPGVLPRSAWGARSTAPSRLEPASSTWNWITVHHSADPDGSWLDGSQKASARAIQRMQSAHMNGDRYGDIGYHFLIDSRGRVFEGRSLVWQGAHSGGANNVGNVGICLIGNFEKERPTRAAVDAMHRLIAVLSQRLHIQARRVVGHRHWKSTACPGKHLLPHLGRYL